MMGSGAGAGTDGEAGGERQLRQPAGQLVPRHAGPAAQRGWPAERAEPARQPVARPGGTADASRPGLRHRQIALVDLLDRVLAGGVVVTGEIRLAIADVDLVTISLRALVSSLSTAVRDPRQAGRPGSGEQAGEW